MRRLLLLLVTFCLLLLTTPAAAQDDPPAPQFLYRDENRLILVDGYTGDATELPFEVTERDLFAWSPDGQYLLVRIQQGENNGYCLNLYKVDVDSWLYDEPISCAVFYAAFSADGTQLIYTSSAENNAILWLYTLADENSQELYRTTIGDELRPAGISDIQWSPTETYLTFDRYDSIMGGSLNTFLVLNVESQQHISITAPDPYYASYYPIWSADDRWFLIVLQEEYVTSGSLAVTNHQGDVYLVNSETGESSRLTYTPAVGEYDIRWTEDGKIAFYVVVAETQEFIFTPQQAMKVEIVPDDEIIRPEPVNPEDYFPDPMSNLMLSPDSNIGAWLSYPSIQQDPPIREFNIGNLMSPDSSTIFSVPIPESYSNSYSNILIGWRPSDYDYPQG
jgi:dipeptidyl aminopeptidase/acylaminoacyl peptidase